MSGEKDWCVYEHVFPNGKRYIGITSAQPPEKRWRHGANYKEQTKIYKAIQKYGWENIEHNIIIDGLDEELAGLFEQVLIATYNTIEDGYNISVGGKAGNGTYLSQYLLKMCQCFKSRERELFEQHAASVVYADRFNREKAEDWNGVADAVTMKRRTYNPDSRTENVCFWWHFNQYVHLSNLVQDGVDVSEWRETYPLWEKFTPETRYLLEENLVVSFCPIEDEDKYPGGYTVQNPSYSSSE